MFFLEFPLWLSGLRMQHCHELWCMWQMWLRSGVVGRVGWAGGNTPNKPPAREKPVARGCGREKKKKKKKEGKEKISSNKIFSFKIEKNPRNSQNTNSHPRRDNMIVLRNKLPDPDGFTFKCYQGFQKERTLSWQKLLLEKIEEGRIRFNWSIVDLQFIVAVPVSAIPRNDPSKHTYTFFLILSPIMLYSKGFHPTPSEERIFWLVLWGQLYCDIRIWQRSKYIKLRTYNPREGRCKNSNHDFSNLNPTIYKKDDTFPKSNAFLRNLSWPNSKTFTDVIHTLTHHQRKMWSLPYLPNMFFQKPTAVPDENAPQARNTRLYMKINIYVKPSQTEIDS